jgi:hypothetical protein
VLRNANRAVARGWRQPDVALTVNAAVPARTVVFQWAGDDSDREMDVIQHDGKSISVPRYDDGHSDDCLEGAVATPAVLIEHKDAVAPEPVEDAIAPEPIASAPTLPIWPGPTARPERDQDQGR